ncbi:MerR family transcriptional regulator [Corynebacterium sp.]|uniref:MerR family transcriptional regulator n=1 Tax=Corynebacterium sp. TaxID=1720 RepID=UPI0028AF7567|nr:MerR family transcriptional regulator [Corynebacterium sp.]
MDHHSELLPIGIFSRLTSISVRMLRYYQDHGLLDPAWVDPHSARRFYTAEQLNTATLIVMLRDAGFPVGDIARVLPHANDPSQLTDELARHHDLLTRKATAAHQQLAHLDRLRTYLKGHPDMTDVTIETIPAMTVASLRRVVDSYAKEGVLWQEIMPALQTTDASFPAGGISGATFHDPDYRESNVDIEVWIQVASPFTSTSNVESKDEPARKVVTSTVRGDYAQIPAVTQRIGEFIAAEGLFTGPMFNIYHVSPAQNPDPTTWVTQLCFPIIETEK